MYHVNNMWFRPNVDLRPVAACIGSKAKGLFTLYVNAPARNRTLADRQNILPWDVHCSIHTIPHQHGPSPSNAPGVSRRQYLWKT